MSFLKESGGIYPSKNTKSLLLIKFFVALVSLWDNATKE